MNIMKQNRDLMLFLENAIRFSHKSYHSYWVVPHLSKQMRIYRTDKIEKYASKGVFLLQFGEKPETSEELIAFDYCISIYQFYNETAKGIYKRNNILINGKRSNISAIIKIVDHMKKEPYYSIEIPQNEKNFL